MWEFPLMNSQLHIKEDTSSAVLFQFMSNSQSALGGHFCSWLHSQLQKWFQSKPGFANISRLQLTMYLHWLGVAETNWAWKGLIKLIPTWNGHVPVRAPREDMPDYKTGILSDNGQLLRIFLPAEEAKAARSTKKQCGSNSRSKLKKTITQF